MLKDRRTRAAILSVAVNLGLVGLQFWGAYLSGSRGLRADAFHSLSDVGVSLLVLLSVLSALKTRKWAKLVEEATAFIIGLIIVGVGLCVLFLSGPAFEEQELQQIPAAIVLAWFSIMISYFIAEYKLRVGRECDAVNLQADGHHSKMDMYSSVAVLIGLLGSWCGLNLDGVASLVVGVLILRIGLVVLAGAVRSALRSDVAVAEAMDSFEGAKSWRTLAGLIEKRAGLPAGRLGDYGQHVASAFGRRKRVLGGVAMALCVAAYAASGFYRIAADEAGVLTQFGKLRPGALEPGLHYRLPAPFSRLYRTKPERVHQLEFGFRTVGQRGVTQEPDAYLWESEHLSGLYEKRIAESIVLTGDKNEVDLNFTLEYRPIREALPDFLFHAADTEAAIRALTERCCQRALGAMELTDVLTTGRQDIEKRVTAALQPLLDELALGVHVTAVRLLDVHPPTKVVPAFRAVATAREEKSMLVHQAEAYRNETLPQARGSAAFLLRDAGAYIDEKRMHAEGDAAYFGALAAAHAAHPAASDFVRYLKSLEASIASSRKIIMDGKIETSEDASALKQYFMTTEFLKWPLEASGPQEPMGEGPGGPEGERNR